MAGVRHLISSTRFRTTSAGMLAGMLLEDDTPIHKLHYEEIKTKLEAVGQVLEHQEMK